MCANSTIMSETAIPTTTTGKMNPARNFFYSFVFATILANCLVAKAEVKTKLAFDYPYALPMITDVAVTGGFWLPRIETNRVVTLKTDFKKCEETRIPNFKNAAAHAWGTFKGIPYDDSDLYKVIEGSGYILATYPDAELKAYVDDVIDAIAGAQEPDGYLYTARTLGFRNKERDGKETFGIMGPARWSCCAASSHELYNLGHLYEAAVAYFEGTGDRRLLDVAIRSAELVNCTFGPGEWQLKAAPGHEEIELALCKLYRVTGEEKYLKLAAFFLEQRGRKSQPSGKMESALGTPRQNHAPVLEQTEALGHAVRAVYLYCAMVDMAALCPDARYAEASGRLWDNVVSRKLHLSGGVGARRRVKYAVRKFGGASEAFGDEYDLPNEEAYLETCAAVANSLWNVRLFRATGEAKYVDVLERILYNGFLSGVALSGDEFFYSNPLASKGGYKRTKWFATACCPVNAVRFIPQIATFAYAVKGDTAYVNLFMESDAKLKLGCGEVAISQKTRYPWNGKVEIYCVPPEDGAKFALNVRIPGWCVGRPVPSNLYTQTMPGSMEDFVVRINGKILDVAPVKGYCVIEREWKKGDLVEVMMNMPVRRIKAHRKVLPDAGRLAVERGPIVYCAEGVDNGGKAFNVTIPADAAFSASEQGIGGQEFVLLTSSNDVKLVPYCIWGNREPGNDMQTWFPFSWGEP